MHVIHGNRFIFFFGWSSTNIAARYFFKEKQRKETPPQWLLYAQNILAMIIPMDWFGFLGASGFEESNLMIICST